MPLFALAGGVFRTPEASDCWSAFALFDTKNTPHMVEDMPKKKGIFPKVSASNSRNMMTPEDMAHVVNRT